MGVPPGTGGLACRQKGPAPATKYFSGNAVSVALMCAVLHQYRPSGEQTGGTQWTRQTVYSGHPKYNPRMLSISPSKWVLPFAHCLHKYLL